MLKRLLVAAVVLEAAAIGWLWWYVARGQYAYLQSYSAVHDAVAVGADRYAVDSLYGCSWDFDDFVHLDGMGHLASYSLESLDTTKIEVEDDTVIHLVAGRPDGECPVVLTEHYSKGDTALVRWGEGGGIVLVRKALNRKVRRRF